MVLHAQICSKPVLRPRYIVQYLLLCLSAINVGQNQPGRGYLSVAYEAVR